MRTDTAIITATATESVDVDPRPPAELPLFAWLSPGFPVGAFAYSHGIEAAVDAGAIGDARTCAAWIGDLVAHGSCRADAVLAAAAFRAAREDAAEALCKVNDLALALGASRERRLETGGMGRAFADAIRAAWPEAACPHLPPAGDIAYPVAFGAACATHRMILRPALEAYVLAFVANLVSAVVRLGPIGQTDAQRVIAKMVTPAHDLARWADTTTLDDLGACAFRSDIAALRHETLYSRLFRS